MQTRSQTKKRKYKEESESDSDSESFSSLESDSENSLNDFIVDDDEYNPNEQLIEFNCDNMVGLEVIKKNDKEVYNKLIEVRDYLNNKFPDIKDLLKSEIKIQDKSKLLELYEILSVTPAPSQEWLYLRDRINKFFKRYKSEYKVYKKHIKEEVKFKQLEENLIENENSLTSLKYKILSLNASDNIKKVLYSKYKELEESEKHDEEYNKLKKWLLTAINLPFDNVKKFPFEKAKFTEFLEKILKKLDNNLYGMADIKEQILLFINSKLLNPDMKGCCLGLIGPPGTGKTSIARIIAEVLDYPFEQISFGGVTNTEFIKGQ